MSGLQKLQDVERFATLFLDYDLLAQLWVRYGHIYPFVEMGAGLLMIAGVLTWHAAPAALCVAGIGAVSVFKAVYIDKRELKCACFGGDSKVTSGFAITDGEPDDDWHGRLDAFKGVKK